MKVIEPGHVYQLDVLDGDEPEILTFVNRELSPHPGTQTQEVLRATVDVMSVLIDRTNHCDACLRWEGNDRIVKALSEAQRQMRLALLLHEQRALERKMEKDGLEPEKLPVGEDGHFKVEQPEPEPEPEPESWQDHHRWVLDAEENSVCRDCGTGWPGDGPCDERPWTAEQTAEQRSR